MNQEFKAAKNVVRSAVAAAPRSTVESILEAAREGRVPREGGPVKECGCFSQRISGSPYNYPDDLCEAYATLAWHHALKQGYADEYQDYANALRQRILVAILRADLRRRDRAMVRELVESAHEACGVGA